MKTYRPIEVISKKAVKVPVGDVALTRALKRRGAIIREEHTRVVRHEKRLTAYICDPKLYAAAAKEVEAGANERYKRREILWQQDAQRGCEAIRRNFPAMPEDELEEAAESTTWPKDWTPGKRNQHAVKTVRAYIWANHFYMDADCWAANPSASAREYIKQTMAVWRGDNAEEAK